MAKRTPRSETRESTGAAGESKTRARARTGAAASPVTPEAAEPFVARAEADDRPNADPPTEDDIRRRAYQRYLERGGGHGLDFDDWLEAERELRQRRGR